MSSPKNTYNFTAAFVSMVMGADLEQAALINGIPFDQLTNRCSVDGWKGLIHRLREYLLTEESINPVGSIKNEQRIKEVTQNRKRNFEFADGIMRALGYLSDQAEKSMLDIPDGKTLALEDRLGRTQMLSDGPRLNPAGIQYYIEVFQNLAVAGKNASEISYKALGDVSAENPMDVDGQIGEEARNVIKVTLPSVMAAPPSKPAVDTAAADQAE